MLIESANTCDFGTNHIVKQRRLEWNMQTNLNICCSNKSIGVYAGLSFKVDI